MKKEYKVGICIPSRDTWKADFGLSLTLATLALWQIGQYNDVLIHTRFCHYKGSNLPSMRNALVEEAINNNCTHILFVDDDESFPMETFWNLLKRMEENNLDILGTNIATKMIGASPVARNINPDINAEETKKFNYVYTTFSKTGIEKVDRTGTGMLLIKREVFANIEKPYFACPPNPLDPNKEPYGEDIYFVMKAQDAGYKVYLDHSVSKFIKHIGDFDFTHQLMEQYYDDKTRTVEEMQAIDRQGGIEWLDQKNKA